MTGMFPRNPRVSERSAAQPRRAGRDGLAGAGLPAMIDGARTETKWPAHKVRILDTDLTPYPSPVGWACQATGSPSIFLPATGPKRGRGTGVARLAAKLHGRFKMVKVVVSYLGDTPRKQRERAICGLQYWALDLPASRRLPGAVIPWANRRCWALAQARAPRFCWTGMSRVARLWGRRPTSPIARSTRAAATERAADKASYRLNTRGAPGFSGAGARRHDIAPFAAALRDALNNSIKSMKCDAAPVGRFARPGQGRAVAG